jgi:hypothetical protein
MPRAYLQALYLSTGYVTLVSPSEEGGDVKNGRKKRKMLS